MRFGNSNDSKAKRTSIGKIRRAQLITTFGPGSIVEMPEYTVIMGATDYWDKKSPSFHEPRLQNLTGVDTFKMPYTTESQNPKGDPNIQAFRFPRIHFCPTCGKLDDYSAFGDPKQRTCIKCKSELVPSRFVVACVNGHLEDFPFEWWVHNGNISDCKAPDNHHKMRIEFKNNTGGLASIVISCSECDKKRSMEGCMNARALQGYKCFGKRPWIGFRKETYDSEECKATMRAMQRGASNLYFGIHDSALTIPPWSSKLQQVILSKWEDLKIAFDNSMDENTFKQMIPVLFADLFKEGIYTVDAIYSEIMSIKKYGESDDKSCSEQVIYEDEYQALCEGYKGDEEEEFHAEITSVDESLSDYIDEVVLVKRLREVMALKGFRRITPSAPLEDDNEFLGVSNNEFSPLWHKQLNWLPAIEMRGEGIFIRLNSERLQAWENLIGDRYLDMKKRMGTQKIGKGTDKFSSRYVLLHTLSHLLIRQLTIDCGYQEAALKERIYSTYPDSDLEMAGILIYTSASDSDGSLGGLVRQGEKDLFETALKNALQEASWCSSDPLCFESEAQGYNSLNYSACHACTLLPETSCESRNCLLDRVAVVGKPNKRSLGYFGEAFEEE